MLTQMHMWDTSDETGAQDISGKVPTSKASSTTSSIRGRVTSSDKKPRRPTVSRRGSTLPNTIHKPRPEFSVDDNESEVEEDLQTQRVRGTLGSTSYSAMRRHSLLRRRSTAIGAHSLPEGEPSEHSDSGEEGQTEHEDADEHGSGDESYEPSEADSVESFTLKVSRF